MIRRIMLALPLPLTLMVALVMYVAGGSAASVSLALASSEPITITNTNGIGVGIRTEPAMAAPKIGGIPEGQSPDYHCYVHAEYVYGTTLWFNVTYGGVTGWYTSFYDDVPLSWQGDIEGNYGIHRCGAEQQAAPAPASPPAPTAAQQPLAYDRDTAVVWALAHAQDTQPHWGGCTWYVSQALWAGGISQEEGVWTDDDRRPAIGNDRGVNGVLFDTWQPGTPASKQAKVLWQYLQDRFPSATITELGPDRFANNYVLEAQPGDIIAYDWGSLERVREGGRMVIRERQEEGLSHLSFVTAVTYDGYPKVSEWGTVDGGTQSPYNLRGWTWSEMSGMWLQEKFPEVRAWLLHFPTR